MESLEESSLFNICLLLLIILYSNSLRKRCYLTRSALMHPKFAPWEHLLNFGDDNSFITMT